MRDTEEHHHGSGVGPLFLASRALIVTIMLLASQVEIPRHSFDGKVTETRIEWRGPLTKAIRDTFVVADARWFTSVAEDGYVRQKFDATMQRNWAFFPGWPMVLRVAHLAGDTGWTGVLVASIYFLGALQLFHRIGLAIGLTASETYGAMALLAFWPASYFFTVPTSESLFFLLTAASVWLALRRQWLAAALFAACASGTRVTGILLLPTLFLLHHEIEKKWWSRRLFALAVAPLGLTGFMLFLRQTTGNAFAFADLQSVWRRNPAAPWRPIVKAIAGWPVLSNEWTFEIFELLVVALVFAAVVVLLRQRRYAFAFFAAATVVIALSSGSLQSMHRYVLSAWPAFYAFAPIARSTRSSHLWIACSAAILGLMSLLFALRVDVALS